MRVQPIISVNSVSIIYWLTLFRLNEDYFKYLEYTVGEEYFVGKDG